MFFSLLLTFIGGAAFVALIMLIIVGIQRQHAKRNKNKK